MVHVTYEIVEHDGGWAYRVGRVYSETFVSQDAAHKAAQRAANEQQLADRTAGIEYQTADGAWHREVARGDDRPETEVEG